MTKIPHQIQTEGVAVTWFPPWTTAAVQCLNASNFDSCQLHTFHSHLTVTLLLNYAYFSAIQQIYMIITEVFQTAQENEKTKQKTK